MQSFSKIYESLPYPDFFAFQEEGETIHNIYTVKNYTSNGNLSQMFLPNFLNNYIIIS